MKSLFDNQSTPMKLNECSLSLFLSTCSFHSDATYDIIAFILSIFLKLNEILQGK